MKLVLTFDKPAWYVMDVMREAETKLQRTARITDLHQVNPTTWEVFYEDTETDKLLKDVLEILTKEAPQPPYSID